MSYANRYVAMCDILGFREFIHNSDLRGAVNQFNRLRTQTIERATEQRIHTINEHGYRLQIDNIPYVLFSDTLLMWVDVNDEEPNSVMRIANFFDGIAALMAYSGQFILPFRVGVSYGECYIDQSTNMFIGQPIVDAYLTEQNQQWFGGACHQSCDNAPFFQTVVIRNGLVIPYEVPIKNDELYLYNAIEWVSWSDVDFEHVIRGAIARATSLDVIHKYRNSLNFYSVVRPPQNLIIRD